MTLPNFYNVFVNDKIIIPMADNSLIRLSVQEKTPHSIIASGEDFTTQTNYSDALIVKKNREYLFGQNVWLKLLGEGFGGIRLVK
ncbi:MAG: hypothetical protein WCX73_03780 [Candidatus Pacearchaeota archaeon]|jgi:hypothetical protein